MSKPFGPMQATYTVNTTKSGSMMTDSRIAAHGHVAYLVSNERDWAPVVTRSEHCPTCRGSGEITFRRPRARTVSRKPCPAHRESWHTVEAYDASAASAYWSDTVSAIHNDVKPETLNRAPYSPDDIAAHARWLREMSRVA